MIVLFFDIHIKSQLISKSVSIHLSKVLKWSTCATIKTSFLSSIVMIIIFSGDYFVLMFIIKQSSYCPNLFLYIYIKNGAFSKSENI